MNEGLSPSNTGILSMKFLDIDNQIDMTIVRVIHLTE